MKFILLNSGRIRAVGTHYSAVVPVSAQSWMASTPETKVRVSECYECHKNELVQTSSRMVHAECLLMKFKCLNCGCTDSDVLD
jgi:hypothetical protein